MGRAHRPSRYSKPNQKHPDRRLNQVKRMNSVMTSQSSSNSSSEDVVHKTSPKRRKSMLRERQLNHYKDISSSESSLDDTAFKDKVLNDMKTKISLSEVNEIGNKSLIKRKFGQRKSK